jgi:hypothetical protein
LADFLREFFAFLKHRRKLWLSPILLVMIILGTVIILAKGSVLAPFVYTLF